jgi:hypothetical protein
VLRIVAIRVHSRDKMTTQIQCLVACKKHSDPWRRTQSTIDNTSYSTSAAVSGGGSLGDDDHVI